MIKRKIVFGLSAALVLGVLAAAPVAAAPRGPYVCTGGSIPAGTYRGLVVTGSCMFGGDVTINGGLRVEPGASLNDHAASQATVRVNGGVFVGEGAVLGLGAYGPPGIKTATQVNGGVFADNPLSLYLSGITVNGNVTSLGGVDPAFTGDLSEFRNFPFKDNTINGNVTIQGWKGGWIGLIRNQVSGNVTFAENSSMLVETPDGCGFEPGETPCSGSAPGTDSDSSEVQTNVIHGNLSCYDNVPPAQVNALDGGQPNQVSGQKRGECAAL